MTKTNSRLTRYFLPLILATIIFSFDACKKTDFSKEEITEPVSKFFTVPANTPGPVLKVVDALKKQNAIGGFIPALAKNVGYAVWNKSVIELSPSTSVYNRDGDSESVDTLVFTPIVQQDSNFVNGFFFSRIVGDSVELHLYRANDYDLYPYGKVDDRVVTAERITLTLMELERNIYGQRKYKVVDSNLFKIYKPDSLQFPGEATIELIENSTQHKMWRTCERLKTGTCTCDDPSNCDYLSCDVCGYTYCFQIDFPTMGGGSSSGSGIPNWPPNPPLEEPGGGGSSGGGGTPIPPGDCTGTNDCRPGSQIIEGKVPCGGCGPGPMVVVPIGDDDPMDSNGYYLSRIAQLDSLLNQDDFALVPCDSLILITMQSYGTMYQDVANTNAPVSVLQRLDSIRLANPNPVWFDNFRIQQLEDASGAVVNCDYFPIQINSFPVNPQTGVAYTPAEYLEYFRFNINSFITSPVGVNFSCISDVSLPTVPPTNFYLNDCNKFSQPGVSCMGTIWHLHIPGPMGSSNDGGVIISDYKDTTYAGGSHHVYFTVSTLETPFDFEHPVAGNRRFGLFNTSAAPNTWTFYIMGVDRIWDIPSIIQNSVHNGFDKSDQLWNNVLGNVNFSISNSQGGNSNYYLQHAVIARPKWSVVENFLRKQINIEQLKTALGC